VTVAAFDRTECVRPAAEPVHLGADLIDPQSFDPG